MHKNSHWAAQAFGMNPQRYRAAAWQMSASRQGTLLA
jgi:ABC-type branched-subunit amino acid transport system permease subunit